MRVAIQGSGADLRVCSRLLIENGLNDDGKSRGKQSHLTILYKALLLF